ncbi:MAG TPA: 50S ribosomal protein L32 [Clostridiales bacterium]|nr:50S ribosomal protein L32 [Clostridiales bacterium]
MGVPKGKMSKSNKRQRRGEDKLKMPGLSNCPQCHALKRPHRACPECGYYKGQEVVETAAK